MPRKPSLIPRTKKNNETTIVVPKTKEPTDILSHLKIDIKHKNETQKKLTNLIYDKEIIIAAGPSGVGKSYISIAVAFELLKDNTNAYNKIIISKPAVEAEENHGFIPGSIREKMDVHIASTLDIFDKIIGKTNRIKLEELGYLEIQPLAFLRGKSIDNSILIMEEAQNMSIGQMKTLLTRIGYNSKFIISGDLDQSDRYKNISQSGLYDALIKHKNIIEIGFMEFRNEDIVRNKVISKILDNYKKDEIKKPINIKLVPTKNNEEYKSPTILFNEYDNIKPIPPKSQTINEGENKFFKKIIDFFDFSPK